MEGLPSVGRVDQGVPGAIQRRGPRGGSMTAGGMSRHRQARGQRSLLGSGPRASLSGRLPALPRGCSGWLVGPVVMWLSVRWTPAPVAYADYSPVVVLPI